MMPFRQGLSRSSRLAGAARRRGFSLIEVMVAMTILSVVLLTIAQSATAVATRGRSSDLVAKRSAALQLEANKFLTVPFASLATWSTSDKTLTHGSFTYTRKLRITSISATRYTVTVTVVPSTDATKQDSLTFDRTLSSMGSPLCTGC